MHQELILSFKKRQMSDMKLAIITDSSAFLREEIQAHDDLYILTIPVLMGGQTYVEGRNLTTSEFYRKMADSESLPTTSQPSLAELETLLESLQEQGYTHVLGLFLSSGISGFWQNIQYLIDDYPGLEIAFPDTKITSAPLGMMVEQALTLAEAEVSFDLLQSRLEPMIAKTKAFIMVDDLNHLVKGGRLSNGAALLGNLLSIKPILYFNEGAIEVYEKVRTEKKAIKRLVDILKAETVDGTYQIAIIHANCEEKARSFQDLLKESGFQDDLPLVPFGAVIGTHLGQGAVAFGITPIVQ